jgi:hypothetical protein
MSSIRKCALLFVRVLAVTGALIIVPTAAIISRAALLDPDIWWHIRVGDWIRQHHAWPNSVILSQHSDRPWVAYSWGFEMLVSGVHRWFGLPGIQVFLIVMQLVLAALILFAMRQVSGRFWYGWGIGALTIYAYYTAPLRPVLLTLVFFVLELLLIFESEHTGEDRLLFWLAPIFLLWANCHIQFIYGIFVLGLYTGNRILNALCIQRQGQGNARPAVFRILGVFALSLVACCIGPYGIQPYKVAFTAARNSQQYQLIQELAALTFRHPGHYAQLLLVMAACWALGRSGRRDLFRVVLLVVSAVVSFRSMRDSWFVCLVAGFIFAEAVRSNDNPAEDVQPNGVLAEWASYAAGAVVAFAVALGLAAHTGLDVDSLSLPVNQKYPVAASDFIRQSKIPGPMFNEFDWGGFLIYNLPEQPVSIDGRVDAYGPSAVARSIQTDAGQEWEQDSDLVRANFALLPVRSRLATILSQDSRYRVAYFDRVSVVFQRQSQVLPTK